MHDKCCKNYSQTTILLDGNCFAQWQIHLSVLIKLPSALKALDILKVLLNNQSITDIFLSNHITTQCKVN